MNMYTTNAAMLALLSMRNEAYGFVKKKLNATGAHGCCPDAEPEPARRGCDGRDQHDQRDRAGVELIAERQQADDGRA